MLEFWRIIRLRHWIENWHLPSCSREMNRKPTRGPLQEQAEAVWISARAPASVSEYAATPSMLDAFHRSHAANFV